MLEVAEFLGAGMSSLLLGCLLSAGSTEELVCSAVLGVGRQNSPC